MILHTLNKSPFSHTAFNDCYRIIADGEGLLLLEDGVYAAMPNTVAATQIQQLHERGVSLFAIATDVKSRGMGHHLPTFVKRVGYQEFVALTTEYSTVHSWY